MDGEFVYGLDYIDEHVAEYNSAGQLRFVIQDANYNVVATTDENNVLHQQYSYEPYGILFAAEEGWQATPIDFASDPDRIESHFGFQGLWRDAETGLYNFRGRDYAPPIGRFLQGDPNGLGLVLVGSLAMHGQPMSPSVSIAGDEQYSDGLSPFEHLRSNPVTNHDPTGMFSYPELLTTVATRAYLEASLFAAAHPIAMQVAGGLLAAANLYGFIQFQEVQAVIVVQPDPLGFLAAEATILRLSTRELLKAGTSAAALFRVSATARQAAATARANVEAAYASEGQAMVARVSRARYPAEAEHIQEAQAAGYPQILTFEPTGATARRAAATRGHSRVAGMDLDEYPPAMFSEGGAGASVRPVPLGQNRGVGASIRNQIGAAPAGTKVKIEVVP